MDHNPRITVWGEYRHELSDPLVGRVYPDGMHGAVAAGLKQHGFTHVRTATLDQPEHGLTEAVLAETDVLTWWGHMAHDAVSDEIVNRVHARVLAGMGLIVLHSGHLSKIFDKLMGTSCQLRWREASDNERLWVVDPSHPITEGLGPYIDLEHEEMYGEHFDIPAPEALVFVSWFKGGEVFRSGCCYSRGRGKIFYFRPGHETYPTYFHAGVRKVIANAVRWAAPSHGPRQVMFPGPAAPLEALPEH